MFTSKWELCVLCRLGWLQQSTVNNITVIYLLEGLVIVHAYTWRKVRYNLQHHTHFDSNKFVLKYGDETTTVSHVLSAFATLDGGGTIVT